MKLNGSWALLPGILAFAVVPIVVLVSIAPQTEMGLQFTVLAAKWMAAWGALTLIGAYFDYCGMRKSVRRPVGLGEFLLAEWLQRL